MGWFIIIIYSLTICNVALGFGILQRVMFVNGGNAAEYTTADYLVHEFHVGSTLIANHLADSLFVRRLYVIWSRNIRIVLLPVFLFICGAIFATTIIITDALVGNDPRYGVVNISVYYSYLGVVIVNTCYVTILVAGRLWWIGRKMNQVESLEQVRETRYQGAIKALVQSGSLYTIVNVLSVIASAKENTAMLTVMSNITSTIAGISATLLVLQLNMFQDEVKGRKVNGPPLTTGATIHFARQQLTRSDNDLEAEWAFPPLIQRRRRASIAAYYLLPHYHDSDKDASCLPTSGPPRAPSNNRSHLSSSALAYKSSSQGTETTAILVEKGFRDVHRASWPGLMQRVH
ncbi:hypothetical protein FRB97_002550 [Tulasnella sp. 331]|nr:hypothetical protein FRB97_002550 [Tulasnella sp. 331]